MANFYSVVELFQDMKSQGLDACDTFHTNRKGLPKNKMLSKQASLGRHEFKVAQEDNRAFCVWHDTKAIMALSNYHDPTERRSVKRSRDHTQTKVVVPACLSDYHLSMTVRKP